MKHIERVKKHQYNMGFLFGVACMAGLLVIVGALLANPALALLPGAFVIFVITFCDLFGLSKRKENFIKKWKDRAANKKQARQAKKNLERAIDF